MAPRVDPKEIRRSGCVTEVVGEGTYTVKSQSVEGKIYEVRRTGHGLACTCAFDGDCHHVGAVLEWIKDGGSGGFRMVSRDDHELCKFCGSAGIIKKEVRRNKSGDVQRYRCGSCGRKFSLNLGFEKMRFKDTVITRALGMYFAKMSIRRIADQFEMEGVDVSYRTVYNWVRKYSDLTAEYADGIVPRVGKWFRADEVWVRVNGRKYYLFATMDDDTRFWLAGELADSKVRHNAEDIFRMTRQMAGGRQPSVMITDKLPAYRKAARRVFPDARHKADAGIRSNRPGRSGKEKTVYTYHKDNNKMERLNGEIRDWEQTRRGIKTDQTPLFTGLRVYYNYAKKHGGLQGRTPAAAAGITVEGRDKWRTLIQNAALERHLGGAFR